MVLTKTVEPASQEGFGFIDLLGNGEVSVEQVDLAMKQMDKKFHTQFYSWIRNENNVDYISYYLRRVITEYEKTQFPAIKRAIQWLVDGWSVQRTAELLIKLFYHWGIGDAKFAGLVLQITRSWQVQPAMVDLVITLVIGERSSKTARFLHHLTSDWSGSKISDLVGAIALRLRWTERYCKHFLLQLACLGDQPWEKKRILVNDIRHQFSQRRLALAMYPSTHNPPPDALVSFTLQILSTILNPVILDLDPIITTNLSLNSNPQSSHYQPHTDTHSMAVSPRLATPRMRPPPVITHGITSPSTRRLHSTNTPYLANPSNLPEDHTDPPTPQPSPCPSTSKVLVMH